MQEIIKMFSRLDYKRKIEALELAKNYGFLSLRNILKRTVCINGGLNEITTRRCVIKKSRI